MMGYAVIAVNQQKLSLLEFGVLKPGKAKDTYKKLQMIFNTVSGLIIKYEPNDLAIEAPFFGKNVQSMLKLGRAQGVAMAAGLFRQVPIFEYSPKKVKQSVTGNGNAGKEQVMKMLLSIFAIKETPTHYDASDALAVALCHHHQSGPQKLISGSKNLKGWEDFLKQNPSRVTVKKRK